MRVTITLDRGDAALGTMDKEVLFDLVIRAVEESAVETIWRQVPDTMTSAGRGELFGDEDRRAHDFELSARAVIGWMLRNFTIAARTVPQVPAADDLVPQCVATWPSEAEP